MRASSLACALLLACPGMAHNRVHLENQSERPWRLVCVGNGEGAEPAAAGLVVSTLDAATGRYVPQQPGSDGGYAIPGKGRIALDTEAPLDDPSKQPGASYRFRLQDGSGRGGPESTLAYCVSWYYACAMNAPCRLGRSVYLIGYGAPMQEVMAEVSPTEWRITADDWPD